MMGAFLTARKLQVLWSVSVWENVIGWEMSGPLRRYLYCVLTVEGIGGADHLPDWGYIRTRVYDSSLTMDTVNDNGRGVPTFDSDSDGPRLCDLTSRLL